MSDEVSIVPVVLFNSVNLTKYLPNDTIMSCLLDYVNVDYIVVVKPVWITPMLGAVAPMSLYLPS